MRKSLALHFSFMLLLFTVAKADVYVYNTTDERMTYQVTLPNGDTKDGVIGEDRGYGPTNTVISSESGTICNFAVSSETGGSKVDVKGPYSRVYLIGIKDGHLQFKPVAWSMENGQVHKRELTIYNATGKPQEFDLVDEKEMRHLSLAPGDQITVPAKNGFGGSSGFHHLKFPGGHRLDNSVRAGDFHVLHWDSRDQGKVQCEDLGHLTEPRGIVKP